MKLPSGSVASRSYPHLFTSGSLVSAVVLCALTANFLFASGHDQQRCIEVVALCIVAMGALLRGARGKILPIPALTGHFLLAFLTLGVASAALAVSFRHAVNEWSCLLLLVVTVVVIAEELAHDQRRLTCLLDWIGIACILYSLRVVIFYCMALASGFQPDWSVVTIGFSNHRFLNHTQTALLPLIVLLCLQSPRSDNWRKAWLTLASFWWAILFVTEARATVLALCVGGTIALTLRRSHARPFLMMMAKTALAGMVLHALLFLLLPLLFGLQPVGSLSNVVARSIANPASDRFLLWKLALELIAAHPWLGVGPQHFAHEGARLYAGAHPHSWILQIAVEWGIPALLCALCSIIFSARALIRTGARIADTDLLNQNIFVCLLVACAAIFVDGLLSGVIVMPQSQLAIALVIGLACGWVRLQRGTLAAAQPASSMLARSVFVALVAAGGCGLLWSVAPDFFARARDDALTPAALAVNPTTHWSRMWEAGYF